MMARGKIEHTINAVAEALDVSPNPCLTRTSPVVIGDGLMVLWSGRWCETRDHAMLARLSHHTITTSLVTSISAVGVSASTQRTEAGCTTRFYCLNVFFRIQFGRLGHWAKATRLTRSRHSHPMDTLIFHP